MKAAAIKRNVARGLLLLHFIGLGMSVGTRSADLVIDRLTSGGALQTLSIGRDLTGALGRTLVLPGFLLLVATGISLTLLRYGLRPPAWVWVKIGLNSIALLIATFFVAPALQGARTWAHWSAAHNELAQSFRANADQASLYGAVVFGLFLLNIPVAIWKPTLLAKASGNRLPKFSRAQA